MQNYKIQNKQAVSGAFTIKKINLQKNTSSCLVPPVLKQKVKETSTSKKDILYIVLVILGLIILWTINAPRLNAYNDCYMQNMKQWGSCQELGN